MVRRKRRAAAFLIVLALGATACADDDDDATDATTESTADTTPASTETTGETATTATPATTAATETPTTEAPAGEGAFDDPRGDLFSEFQSGFDRTHPFQSLESYCVEHEAAAELTDTDDGITAESITLVHLRSRLEQLEGIGFAVPVGDTVDMFQAFADAINDCGGIRGRQIDLKLVEVDALGGGGADIDALRNAACIEATEDSPGVIVMNSTGFQGSANLCLVEEAGVAFISTQGQSDEYMARGEDRLVSLSPTQEESLRFLANDLIASGALDDQVIGVIQPDTPGIPEAVQGGLVDILEDAGLEVAVYDTIGCAGSSTCTEGIQDSVANMLDAGVTAVFNTLNVVSWPQYLNELVAQGVAPGSIQFYASDVNSQAGELVSSKILSFGGEAAGALYNGALIVDDADTGGYRIDGFDELPFEAMCHDTYEQYSSAGASHTPESQAETGAWGMTLTVCAEMRMAARAIYDAGDNPTREDIYAALANLGPIDVNGMLPASVSPGKTAAPDAVHTLVFEYPCERDFPYAENICITPTDDFRPAER
jgi:Periplasmic binding protein